ncbi:MAG: pimeloyl-ACP methyl ester carboxylesterase [Myxococcota bacterium]
MVGDYVPELSRLLATTGANLFLAEYRGYGASTGEPALGKMLDDVAAIFAHLDLPADRVIAFGRSVGSLFAIELARQQSNIAGLVLESGIADVHERLRLRVSPEEIGWTEDTFKTEIQQRMDHESTLRNFAGPTLVIHAKHDHLVDVSHAARNHARAGPKSTLVVFERGNHNTIFPENQGPYIRHLKRFITP